MLGSLIAIAAAALGMPSASVADSARHPFPQHVTYAAGTIRPQGASQQAMDDDVRRFYAWWKAHYLIEAGGWAGGTAYRVGKGRKQSGATVSEGQGYGLIIVALMAGEDPDARRIFDGLFAFARAHPSDNSPDLMAWKIPTKRGDADSAFDGDADIAYALMLADAQWGAESSVYRIEAERRIDALRRSSTASTSGLPLLGDWVRSSDTGFDETMGRTSDFMPAHFASFARFTRDRQWRRAADSTRTVVDEIQASLSPKTGLLPDFVTELDRAPRAAPANFLETRHDDAFFTNAARVPWRIGTDALINGNARSLAQARKISTWIERRTGGDPEAIRAGYALDGTALRGGNYFTALYAAPLGVAAMTNPQQQQWLDAIYASVRRHHEGYYEDSVALLSMLVMTGNYWDPTRIR